MALRAANTASPRVSRWPGVGVKAGVAVLVIGVIGQVAARGDLLRGGKAGADDVAGTGKALGAVGDGLLTERDVEVDLALDDVDEGRGHCVLKLDDHILAGMPISSATRSPGL